MESSNESYHISFFKPTTERARHNRNMVIWLVSIWFIAIFGFHIVLKIIEEPVPEPAYTEFAEAWNENDLRNMTETDLKALARSFLNVLGKIDVPPETRSTLQNAFSWSVYQLTPETGRSDLINEIQNFEKSRAKLITLEDEEYIQQKSMLSAAISPLIDLSEYDVRRKLIPFGVESEGIAELEAETESALPGVMEKYLIHNRSVLTDIKILGFPFHYFYTAVFLLILFVGLCWIYCVRTDAMNRKLEIAE
ncbi:MAG: DUF4212 domain-containing protein [Bacteroidota bacterium]